LKTTEQLAGKATDYWHQEA